jgi:DNA-binding Lrp family transcriptional regulator
MEAQLDETDRRILEELTRDGRMSVRALAEAVNVSRSHAYSRLERLQDLGVLEGFTAVVNPARSGLGTSAYVTLTVRQHSWRDLSERLRQVPEVKHMALVGGGDVDVILLVRTRDNESLRRVVLDVLQAIPGVLSTHTFLIFEDLANP